MLPQPKRINRQHNRVDPRLNFRAENISRGGIYVCGTQVLPKGARIAMEVETKRHGPLWVETGEVVWSKPFRRAGVPIPPGMGIRFIRMSQRSRKLITEEIDRINTRRPRPGRLRRLTPVPPAPIRVETRDIIPIQSKSYLLQLLVAIIAGVIVGAFTVSLIFPGSKGPAEPSQVVQAKVIPTVTKPKPRPRPVKKVRLPPPPRMEKPVVLAKKVEGPHSVVLPEFEKTRKGWRMVLEASAPVKIKHFKLKDPPRLAVDLYKTDYTGDKKRLSSPVGFISRVRVGKQPGFVRFVLDFKGKRVPRHKVTKDNGRAVVSFF